MILAKYVMTHSPYFFIGIHVYIPDNVIYERNFVHFRIDT